MSKTWHITTIWQKTIYVFGWILTILLAIGILRGILK